MKKEIVLVFVLIGILLCLSLFVKKQEYKTIKTLKIGGVVLNIEVADTDDERVRGLSGRSGLGENEGMLFVFDTEGYYGIWMKEMNFPIDIAWLDKDKKVLKIENAVDPDTYPKVFNSPVPSLYVLETKAGFFEKFKIKIGDTLDF